MQIVGFESDKKTDFDFFWGREGPWSGATEEGVGGGVVRSRAQGGGVVEVTSTRPAPPPQFQSRGDSSVFCVFLGPGGGVARDGLAFGLGRSRG